MSAHGFLIVNPQAAGGKAGRRAGHLLAGLGEGWRAILTASMEEGIAITQQRYEQGNPLCAAVGGDGTLCSVVNGYMRALCQNTLPEGAAVTCIPFGTGNDAARELGVPKNPYRALAALKNLQFHCLDIGVFYPVQIPPFSPSPTPPFPIYFLNVSGIGFDAHVNATMDLGIKKRFGALAYVAAVLQTLRRFRPLHVQIRLDGEEIEEQITLVALANGRSYGGGMHIAPSAQFDDGWLDVCLVGAMGKIELLRNFPKVFQGTHIHHPAVQMLRAREIQIETEEPEPISIDGDILAYTSVTCRVLPGVIRFGSPAFPSLRSCVNFPLQTRQEVTQDRLGSPIDIHPGGG